MRASLGPARISKSSRWWFWLQSRTARARRRFFGAARGHRFRLRLGFAPRLLPAPASKKARLAGIPSRASYQGRVGDDTLHYMSLFGIFAPISGASPLKTKRIYFCYKVSSRSLARCTRWPSLCPSSFANPGFALVFPALRLSSDTSSRCQSSRMPSHLDVLP